MGGWGIIPRVGPPWQKGQGWLSITQPPDHSSSRTDSQRKYKENLTLEDKQCLSLTKPRRLSAKGSRH